MSLPWCSDKISFINCIRNLRNYFRLISCSSVHVLSTSTESYSVSFSVSCIPLPSITIFFSNTFIFLLNFHKYIRKPEHVLNWETFCNRDIFKEFIVWFQKSKRLIELVSKLVQNMNPAIRILKTWTLYLRSRFNLTVTNPMENAGLVKVLHLFAASMGMLQMRPLLLKNLLFLRIAAIFWNKICLGINFFEFLKILQLT